MPLFVLIRDGKDAQTILENYGNYWSDNIQ